TRLINRTKYPTGQNILTGWIIDGEWLRQRLILFIWKRHVLPLVIYSGELQILPRSFQLQRDIFASKRVLTPLFCSFLLTEAMIKFTIEQTDMLGTDLFSAFIVFQRNLAHSPGASTCNGTSNEISAKWYSFCCLFCKVTEAQSPSHNCDKFASMF